MLKKTKKKLKTMKKSKNLLDKWMILDKKGKKVSNNSDKVNNLIKSEKNLMLLHLFINSKRTKRF